MTWPAISFSPLFFYGICHAAFAATSSTVWLALRPCGFSMLPVYHRQYDAKLILLAVPPAPQLWARRGANRLDRSPGDDAAFVLNGDLPWVAVLAFVNHMNWSTAGPSGRLLTALGLSRSLSLLAMEFSISGSMPAKLHSAPRRRRRRQRRSVASCRPSDPTRLQE